MKEFHVNMVQGRRPVNFNQGVEKLLAGLPKDISDLIRGALVNGADSKDFELALGKMPQVLRNSIMDIYLGCVSELKKGQADPKESFSSPKREATASQPGYSWEQIMPGVGPSVCLAADKLAIAGWDWSYLLASAPQAVRESAERYLAPKRREIPTYNQNLWNLLSQLPMDLRLAVMTSMLGAAATDKLLRDNAPAAPPVDTQPQIDAVGAGVRTLARQADEVLAYSLRCDPQLRNDARVRLGLRDNAPTADNQAQSAGVLPPGFARQRDTLLAVSRSCDPQVRADARARLGFPA